jgi:hypothetical protein
MNYPDTKLKTFKGHLITKGDKLFIGDFIVGNLGSYLIFQEDGNFVHYDVFGSTNKDDAVWSSEFQSENAHHIILDNDGYLKICDKYSTMLKTVFDTKANEIFIEDYNIVQTPFTEGNRRRILEQENSGNTQNIPKSKSRKNKESDKIMNTFIDDYKTMDKHKELRGGIILIGSLFWDDNIKDKDNKRKEWRDTFLEMGKTKDIKFPIRYGRESGNNYKTYTMVVSNSETYKQPDNLGTAKIIPLKTEISVAEHIYQLALAEGIINTKDGNKSQPCLKIFGGNTTPWGIIGYAINNSKGFPELEAFKQEIRKVWSKQISDNRCYDSYPKDIKIQDFIKDFDNIRTDNHKQEIVEKIPFDSNGSINFLDDKFWTEGPAKDFDYVICTLAYPSPKYITCTDIAKKAVALINDNDYDPRQYYDKTSQDGIITLGDDYINYLKQRLIPTHTTPTKNNQGEHTISDDIQNFDIQPDL